MKALITLIVLIASCSKQQDYSYLNADRRPMVVRISERYNNPPEVGSNGMWKYHTIVRDTLDRDTRASDYANIAVDTIPKNWKDAWCSIDKKDSTFKIEIRKFVIN